MRLVITDLKEETYQRIFPQAKDHTDYVFYDASIKHCIGCFACWDKTPGACVLKDAYSNMGQRMSKLEELIIISQSFYGGFSPFVKNVLDRSISYIHPYFENRNGEMHHKRRYDNGINLKVYLYGQDISERERLTAEKLVKANAINLDCPSYELVFLEKVEELEGLVC